MERTARLSKDGGREKLSGLDVFIVQSPLSSLEDLIKAEAQIAIADRKEWTEHAKRLNTHCSFQACPWWWCISVFLCVTYLFCYTQVLLNLKQVDSLTKIRIAKLRLWGSWFNLDSFVMSPVNLIHMFWMRIIFWRSFSNERHYILSCSSVLL